MSHTCRNNVHCDECGKCYCPECAIEVHARDNNDCPHCDAVIRRQEQRTIDRVQQRESEAAARLLADIRKAEKRHNFWLLMTLVFIAVVLSLAAAAIVMAWN